MWAGSHRRAAWRHRARRHGIRLSIFSVIGIPVFLVCLGLQAVLVELAHLAEMSAYAIQAVVSIELSFVLNRYLTWRDRMVKIWSSCLRFNIQRVTMMVPSLFMYAALVHLGLGYITANLATTSAFMLLSYAVSHWWSFAPATPRAAKAPAPGPRCIRTAPDAQDPPGAKPS